MKIFGTVTSAFLLIICFSGCAEESIVTVPVFSCFDGLQNGNEAGIDCGGDCDECALNLNIPATGYDSPLSYEGLNLVWSDEFDSLSIDLEKWSFNEGDGCPALCGWGNNELQYFTDQPENIFLTDGYLVIRALRENINGYNYSSSRINTKDKFEFQYGRIDIRATMPSAVGSWIAMFMLNKNYSIFSPGSWWPSGGEIDIMEYLGEANEEVLGTAHFGVDFPANHRFVSSTYSTPESEKFDESFHVFSIIWKVDEIKWLVNGIEYHTITPSTTSALNQPYPFNDEYFMIMSYSVGGNLPVSPIMTDFPDRVVVDYVRVFQ
ncbi:MAG: glycoside hydrolase family 16 protein [Bacteroidota bacterium]